MLIKWEQSEEYEKECAYYRKQINASDLHPLIKELLDTFICYLYGWKFRVHQLQEEKIESLINEKLMNF